MLTASEYIMRPRAYVIVSVCTRCPWLVLSTVWSARACADALPPRARTENVELHTYEDEDEG